VLDLLGEGGGLVVSPLADELELFGHNLLVGSDSDEVGVGGGVGGLAPSPVLGGPGEGVDGVVDFLLSE
jgi:hypothetical protein